MTIQIATSDAEIAACYPVMQALRPHIPQDQFISRIRNQEAAGYRLAFLLALDEVVAVAGFRVGDNLAWGRFLYVDDLVTLPSHRSEGYGTLLLAWLKDYALKNGCLQLHLDSRSQRKDAHRFYEREGLTVTGLHFMEDLSLHSAKAEG
jgi:GNAT superfamily N-acetyltransferase